MSDFFFGEWKVQNAEKDNYLMTFTRDALIVDGEEQSYQNVRYTFLDDIEACVIKTGDGQLLSFVYPDKDREKAVLIEPYDDYEPLEGYYIFAMHRTEFPDFWEYYHQYLSGED